MYLRELEPITTLRVETENSLYHISVLDPASLDILVMGGPVSRVPMRARLEGASFGGSLLKQGYILSGMRMELRLDGGRVIVTSPVQHITIERGVPVAV